MQHHNRPPYAPSTGTLPPQPTDSIETLPADALALVILWSAREPERVGEVALLPHTDSLWVLGRELDSVATPRLLDPGDLDGSDDENALLYGGPGESVRFFAQRPEGLGLSRPPRRVRGESISRRQLEISEHPAGLLVRNVGRCKLAVNGRVTQSEIVGPGDTLYLSSQLLLFCTRRPLFISGLRAYPRHRLREFGKPDAEGLIGESLAMWTLREQLASCAQSNLHVLVVGESGSGKELAARAIHSLSQREGRKLIADNIAAIPSSLAAALLFGNKKNFPNPGMDEHVGLIGAAHGSTLFLDEIGDMPEEVQPMFLRVADKGGEYFRLGEKQHVQRSDFRLVGATNRPEKMRYELKRRFEREVCVPSLDQRKEDIPLLIDSLLHHQIERNDGDVLRFLDPQNHDRPRVHPRLIEQLVHHSYKTNVSEIGFLLGRAMAESSGNVIRALQNFAPLPAPTAPSSRSLMLSSVDEPRMTERAQLFAAPLAELTPKPRPAAPLPSPQLAQQTLDELGGHVTQAAAVLGISRDQLNRMIYREGLSLKRARPRLHGDPPSSGGPKLT